MRKLKTEEAEIAALIENHNQETIESFKMLTACLYVYDELNNTNHLKNVKKIYLNNHKDSIVKTSDKLFTNERTLTRYRKKYIKCFRICGSLIKRLSGVFSFLNKL